MGNFVTERSKTDPKFIFCVMGFLVGICFIEKFQIDPCNKWYLNCMMALGIIWSTILYISIFCYKSDIFVPLNKFYGNHSMKYTLITYFSNSRSRRNIKQFCNKRQKMTQFQNKKCYKRVSLEPCNKISGKIVSVHPYITIFRKKNPKAIIKPTY